MLEKVKNSILTGDFRNINNLVMESLKNGFAAIDIYNSMNDMINIVGEKFGTGELFLPELMASSQAMKSGMEILKPEMLKQKANVKKLGKILIGTNKGDIHDIGKSLIILHLENAGFEVKDLGVDVSDEQFVEEVMKEKPDILGMSALLTSTLMGQKEVIKKLKDENIRSNVKVIVGGAPATTEWANEIGADGYGADANAAVQLSKRLLNN